MGVDVYQISSTPYALPLRTAWPAGGSALTTRTGWLIRIDHRDHCGWGDCGPLEMAGTESPASAEERLAQFQRARFETPEALLTALHKTRPEAPATCCGVETALLDLLARKQKRPLRCYLAPAATGRIRVNAMAGSACAENSRMMEQQGFDLIKLKIGGRPLNSEIDCITRLCSGLAVQTRLRLDANGAWNVDDARRFIEAMEKLPVESIEEPLNQPTLRQLTELQAATRLPLGVDESLRRLGIERVLNQPGIRRLILKPMVLGGLTPTLNIARLAAEAAVEVVVTSTVESAIGVRAACELAGAIEAFAPPQHHGLATSSWLAQDLAAPPRITRGRITLSSRPGLGITP